MNYLELVRKLRQECGIPGAITTVQNQTGEAKRCADWVKDAWLEIQGRSDVWDFLRAEFTMPIPGGTGEILPAAATFTPTGTWKSWHKETFRLYRTALGIADEQYFVEWDYQVFRNTYRYNQQTPGRPAVFAERARDSAIMLGPVPDEACTLVGEAQLAPIELTADTDTPAIDAGLHLVIVYKAMEYYALYEGASEVLARSERGMSRLMPQLERKYLPEITLGDPLA